MIRAFKRYFYFSAAGYFAFWAKLFLARWKPRVVVAIGSSGKTTLLHLLAAELGDRAVVSYKANSAFGIPFNILGLERKTFGIGEWVAFAFRAPLHIFRPLPRQEIYVAEADAERPGEGRFLARLLRPDTVVWLSLEEAHGVNYDRVAAMRDGGIGRDAVKKEMAHEFGYFLDHARSSVVLQGDNPFIKRESIRSHVPIVWVSERDILGFEIAARGVRVVSAKGEYHIPSLIPREAAVSVIATIKAAESLSIETDASFKAFTLPPGRSSVLRGIRGVTIIDSSYNATIGGMEAMIALMRDYPASGEKWLVLGDMVEQGESETEEHTALARMIEAADPARVVLVGPRLRSVTLPILLSSGFAKRDNDMVASFLMPAEALEYLRRELRGGETVLFKGARFLEGVIEKLLADPEDARLLCRRENIWARRRKKWGV